MSHQCKAVYITSVMNTTY